MSARKASGAQTTAARDVKAALRALADPERARSSAWFFKTGPGEYGEGDTFIGVRVPAQRKIARTFRELSLSEIETLLKSPVHEDRFTALEILVMRYERSDAKGQEQAYRFYLAHTDRINNWDLVDTSAPYIVGEHLRARSRKPVYALARSKQLWERRIAMVSCAAWIRHGDLDDAFAIARLLLDDPNDIIHKAVGWMLREAGTHSGERLLAFLEREYPRIARTTLRYAIEHFTPVQRKRILGGEF
jgi:3-methyladenine DNA glycosylase AlkD